MRAVAILIDRKIFDCHFKIIITIYYLVENTIPLKTVAIAVNFKILQKSISEKNKTS